MTSTNGTDVPFTLNEADANISESLARPAGFADAVRHLADIKAATKALTDRRDVVFPMVRQLHHQGVKAVRTGANDAGWYLKEKITPARTERRVYSKDVYDADPKLWEKCRVPRRELRLAVPRDYNPADLGVRLPALPHRGASAAAVVDAYKSPLYTDQLSALKADERDTRAVLDKIAAEIGWDGDEQRFTDRWKITLIKPTFNGDRLKLIDPDTYMALSKVVEVAEARTVIVVDLQSAVTTGEAELDEIDEIDGQ